MFTNLFRKAVKYNLPLRMAIQGFSGTGKTKTALRIATELVKGTGKRVAMIDTEKGSGLIYADEFDFDHLRFDPPYDLEVYIRYIQAAVLDGYGCLICDTISHAWFGEGGALDMVNSIGRSRYKGNDFGAWSEVTPLHNRFFDNLVGADIHMIATMRTKVDYAQQTLDNGKSKIVKLGTFPIQREGYDYEFNIVLEMDAAHTGTIIKIRGNDALDGKSFDKPGEDLAFAVKEWLAGAPYEMDIVEAGLIKSPAGKDFANLTDEQLQMVLDSSKIIFTPRMKLGAKVLLLARHPESSVRASMVETSETEPQYIDVETGESEAEKF